MVVKNPLEFSRGFFCFSDLGGEVFRSYIE